MGNIYFERVQAIRRMMADNGWDAVVIGASDPHSSEYPAPRWQAVQWVSGFTGEAGDIVITADHAGLWTDSRYFIQALEQLQGTGIELHKTRQPDSVTIPEWLAHVEERKKSGTSRQSAPGTGVSLLTMHGAKGLEFDTVFIIRANEGVVPYKKAKLEEEVEEERRLFYVAMTRAKKRLFVSYVREKNGKDASPSRFVGELFHVR